MKMPFAYLLFTIFFAFAANSAVAQDKTIILVRHAEKADSTSQDPELSAEGKQRAERLMKTAGRFKPGAFYSTNFKRTRDTLAPWAAKRKKTVEAYEARDAKALIDKVMAGETKRIVIAGHSNTIPGLANQILKKDVFKNLDDSEYGIIWVFRIDDGKVKKLEMFTY